jgi:protein-S-isoprenylcysteine O-methyltransferase Ste14
MPLSQTICWTIALCEVAAIFAARNPTLPISQEIIGYLVFSGSVDTIRPTYLFFLGTFIVALGGYIRYSCFRALGRLFTFEMTIRDEHTLITDGPYSIVRHPSYTGALLTLIGIICWHSSPVRNPLYFFGSLSYLNFFNR